MNHEQTDITDELAQNIVDAAATDTLTVKQERALQAILSHRTLKEAALAAGISYTTLWRFTHENETFKRRLREAGTLAVKHAALRLQMGSGEAVAVFEEVMRDKDAPASARIAAAKSVYDRANRVVENDELKSKIEELEEFIKTKQKEAMMDDAVKEGW